MAAISKAGASKPDTFVTIVRPEHRFQQHQLSNVFVARTTIGQANRSRANPPMLGIHLDRKERFEIETRQCIPAHLVGQTIECVACRGRQGECGSEKTCSNHLLKPYFFSPKRNKIDDKVCIKIGPLLWNSRAAS